MLSISIGCSSAANANALSTRLGAAQKQSSLAGWRGSEMAYRLATAYHAWRHVRRRITAIRRLGSSRRSCWRPRSQSAGGYRWLAAGGVTA